MIRSPIKILETQQGRDALLLRIASDLLKVHKDFLDRSQQISEIIHKRVGPKGDPGKTPTRAELQQIVGSFITKSYIESLLRSMVPFIKGEKGDDGVFTDEHISKVTEIVLKHIKVPEPKEPVITDDHIEMIATLASKKIKVKEIDPMEVIDKIMKLPAGKKLSAKHIDGLEQTISAIHHQLGRGYLHGGGDTVKAGSNVTITQNNDGTKTISSTGGSESGGGSYLKQIVSGTIDGSNKTFTIPTTVVGDTFIFEGNKPFIGGVDYTLSGTTITYNIAPPIDDALSPHYLYSGGGTVITPTITSGSGAPASTPAALGDQYVDTLNGNVYYAIGTSSNADWRLLASY